MAKKKTIQPYDVEEAFRIIEEELLHNLKNKLEKHINDEIDAGEAWQSWQTEQMKALQQYRFVDNKHFKQRYSKLNNQIRELLKETWNNSRLNEESAILRRVAGIKKETVKDKDLRLLNTGKMDALLNATISDLEKAEYATLRMLDDQYRKIIFNSQVYLNTGSGTLRSAIDMATKDFYANGIDSIQYRNGARVNITSYSEMVLRTSNKRAALQGEAAARDEYGLSLVIITRRGVACPKCQQFCGRVCIDDVYGNGKPDGKHPLLSSFMNGGLYHPNCKDTHTTYYEGISPAPKRMTAAEQAEATRIYDLEQHQRYNERQIRKWKRLEQNSLDPANREAAAAKRKEWQRKQKTFVDSHIELRRKYDREKIY